MAKSKIWTVAPEPYHQGPLIPGIIDSISVSNIYPPSDYLPNLYATALLCNYVLDYKLCKL